jgi:hypothetical protein
MVLADEQAVRAVLGKYEGAIYEAVQAGWDEWRTLSLAGKLLFPARSRACLVYDFIVQRAIAAFAEDQKVRVLRGDETAKFLFADAVALRFKKANDNGLGSNIRTQATLGFVHQQQELPGLPNVHKVEVVYVLNSLQTQVDEVVVTARDGDVKIWNYSIAPDSTAAIIPMSPPVVPDSGHGARIKIRGSEDGEKTKANEK